MVQWRRTRLFAAISHAFLQHLIVQLTLVVDDGEVAEDRRVVVDFLNDDGLRLVRIGLLQVGLGCNRGVRVQLVLLGDLVVVCKPRRLLPFVQVDQVDVF